MATSGTIVKYFKPNFATNKWVESSTRTDSYLALTFNWSLTSQSPVTNSSQVTWSFVAEAIPTTYSYVLFDGTVAHIKTTSTNYYEASCVKINGTKIATGGGTTITAGTPKTLASATTTIKHDSDGNASPTIEAWILLEGVYNDAGQSVRPTYYQHNMTGGFELPTIIPYGILDSAPNFNDEENPTINYTIPNGVTNVEAYISFSGQTETIKARPIDINETSYTFNFTEAERTTLRSILSQGLSSKQVTFYLRSTTGSTVYYSSKTATLSIINYTPTLSPEVYDTNSTTLALTNNQYVLVNGLSNAYYSTGAQGRKGATITSQTVKNGEITKTTTTGTFEKVSSPNFYFTATDSFGRSVTADYNLPASNWIPYVKITCSAEFTDMTADGDLKVTLKGKFYKGNFGANGKTNRMRVNYDITEGESDDFNHVDLGYADLASNYGNSFTVSGNDYTYILNIKNLDYTKSYSFRVRVSDEVSVTPAEVASVISPTPIFDWSRTDFNFNVPVTIQGGSVPTIQAQGTSGIWTYRTWSDGTAECWGKKDVSVTFPSSANWGGLYTTGAISASNISFPFGLFAETPIVNASLLVRSAGGILMAPGGAGSNIANMDQTGVYEIARGATVSGTQYYTINYQVIGKWK